MTGPGRPRGERGRPVNRENGILGRGMSPKMKTRRTRKNGATPAAKRPASGRSEPARALQGLSRRVQRAVETNLQKTYAATRAAAGAGSFASPVATGICNGPPV